MKDVQEVGWEVGLAHERDGVVKREAKREG